MIRRRRHPDDLTDQEWAMGILEVLDGRTRELIDPEPWEPCYDCDMTADGICARHRAAKEREG